MVIAQVPHPPARASAPAGSGPVTFGRRHPRRRVVGASVTQLVLAELAGAAVLVGYEWGGAALPVGVVLAAALLLTAFGRGGGRWWAEWLLLRLRYAARGATTPGPATDAREAALGRLAPGLSVRTVVDRGTRIGIGRDDAGWFSAVAVSARPGLRGDPVAALPLDALARVLDEGTLRVSALQVVLHSIPAPAAELGESAPAARSYRALVSGSAEVAPIDAQCWVAVRLDPAAAAEATASRGGGLDGVHRALSTAVGRLGKAIGGVGLEHSVLDGDDLLEALARSCGVAGNLDPGTVRGIGESWSNWHAGAHSHACFWVRDWPRLTEASGLLGRLAHAPAVLTSVALTIEPHDERNADLRCVVRVADTPDRLPASCLALRRIAEVSGSRLLRLNGEQAPGVYGSAPTGGGAQ